MKKNLLYTAMFSLLALAACNKEDEPSPTSSTSSSVSTTYVDEGHYNYSDEHGGCNSNNNHNENEANQLMVASFNVENQYGKLDERADLLLTNNSVNAVAYEWDFGNGDKSTEVLPSYSYDMHGNYTIKLKTTDARGNAMIASQDVVVLCVLGGGPHEF